jgi:hypothetical protein
MKMFLWAISGTAVAGLTFWMVYSNEAVPARPLPLFALALVDGFAAIGALWMLYMAIRHEKRPLPWILLACIPYFFLGYYFERIRPRGLGRGSRLHTLR